MNNYPYQQLSLFPQYQQPYQPYQTSQPTQPTQSGVTWVTSEEIARNYSVAPGTSMIFMNENEPYLYMKSADTMGKPTFKKCRLVDETEPPKKRLDLSEYIKREEIENIVSDMVQKEVEKRMGEISFRPTKKPKQEDNE